MRWELLPGSSNVYRFPVEGEGFEQDFRLGAHQVHVKEESAQGADGLDDLRAKGNIRHKVTVHNVQMQPVRAGL